MSYHTVSTARPRLHSLKQEPKPLPYANAKEALAAMLVDSAAVCSRAGMTVIVKTIETKPATAKRVLDALRGGPERLDAIVKKTGLSRSCVSNTVRKLRKEGLIVSRGVAPIAVSGGRANLWGLPDDC